MIPPIARYLCNKYIDIKGKTKKYKFSDYFYQNEIYLVTFFIAQRIWMSGVFGVWFCCGLSVAAN